MSTIIIIPSPTEDTVGVCPVSTGPNNNLKTHLICNPLQ